MTKDKRRKSLRRRRKPEKSDCFVFSNNWSVIGKYVKNGTSVAVPDTLAPNFFKELLGKLTQQKEARYE